MTPNLTAVDDLAAYVENTLIDAGQASHYRLFEPDWIAGTVLVLPRCDAPSVGEHAPIAAAGGSITAHLQSVLQAAGFSAVFDDQLKALRVSDSPRDAQ